MADPGSSALPLEARLTVVVTTSAAPVHPDTAMLREVLGSLVLAGAEGCRVIIVCDGHADPGANAGATSKFKRGRITQAAAAAYAEYRASIAKLAAGGEGLFANVELLELGSRHGFGHAVLAALALVVTEHVMVVQHDRNFNRAVDLGGAVLGLMDCHPDVQYIGLLTGRTVGYAHYVRSRYGHLDITPLARDDGDGGTLLPLLFMFDSTHVARVDWYLQFVFGDHVRTGNPRILPRLFTFVLPSLAVLFWKALPEPHGCPTTRSLADSP